MPTNYDDLVDDYQHTKRNPIKQYSEEWTFFNTLGDVRGLSVLDAACGDGYYTRAIKRRGAARVLGVDVSEGMIARARATEEQHPLGIEYLLHDVTSLGALGLFDLATVVYLFTYAPDDAALLGMARAIRANLRAGGRMVAVTINPDLGAAHLAGLNKYGSQLEVSGDIRDGATLTTTIWTPQGPVTFSSYYWSKATYERTFALAGFDAVQWQPMQVSPEGLAAHGDAYWREHLAHPAITVFAAAAV